MAVDKDPSGRIRDALKYHLDAELRTDDGFILSSSELRLTPELSERYDATDVLVIRDDEMNRTVCSVQRPPTAAAYWRHDTYVVWDDGRDAMFSTDFTLDAIERRTLLHDMSVAQDEIKARLYDLIEMERFTESQARYVLNALLDDIASMVQAVDSELLRRDELDDRTNREIIDRVAALHRQPYELEQVLAAGNAELRLAAIGLYRAYADALKVRADIVDKFERVSGKTLDVAEAGLLPPMAAEEAVRLTDMLIAAGTPETL